MAFWFNRYKNYTKRGEVYLFTLRDYCEIMLIKQYGGNYLVRKDMPLRDGYLMEFPVDQLDRIVAFLKGEDTAAVDNGSLVTAKKNFLVNAIEKEFVGDGTKTSVQLSSHALTADPADFVITSTTAAGVETAMTVTVAEGTATVKASGTTKATITLANGIVTFVAAPADKEVWSFQVKEIKFVLNYQLLGNTLYAGLSEPKAPTLVTMANLVSLDATGTEKVFQLPKNIKKGTVNITVQVGEADAVTGITDTNGVLSKTVEATTTVYGHIDYISGVMTLVDDPEAVSYKANYYVL